MASPLMHSAASYSLYRVALSFFPEWRHKGGKRIILFFGVLGAALIADADALPFLWGRYLGDTHNQYSHSLVAAGLIGVGVALLGSLLTRVRVTRWLLWGLLGALSHVAIDFLTLGRGIKLFWPLTDVRFSSPIPMFYGLRWSEGLWSSEHLVTCANEALMITGGILLIHALKLKAPNVMDHVRKR